MQKLLGATCLAVILGGSLCLYRTTLQIENKRISADIMGLETLTDADRYVYLSFGTPAFEVPDNQIANDMREYAIGAKRRGWHVLVVNTDGSLESFENWQVKHPSPGSH